MRLFIPLLLTLVAQASLGAAELPSVLSHMNTASAQYKGMTAKIRSSKYIKLVDATEEQTGNIWVRRDAKGQMTLRIAFLEPAPTQVRVEKSTVEMYKERINQIDEYDLKSRRALLEEALLVGYGTSGDHLKERYEIKLIGEENLEGVPTVRLLLTPKDPDARANGQTLEMWISTANWQPVQQKLNESDGDYQIYSYTDMKINPGLKASDLEFDLSRSKSKPKRVKPRS